MWKHGVQEEETLGERDTFGLKKQMEGDLKKGVVKRKAGDIGSTLATVIEWPWNRLNFSPTVEDNRLDNHRVSSVTNWLYECKTSIMSYMSGLIG